MNQVNFTRCLKLKNFRITLEKLGRFGNDSDGYTLEPDDTTVVWRKEKQFNGIIKAFKWVKNTHPKLGLTLKSVDKLDQYNYRYYVSGDCGHYENAVGLQYDSVGLVYVIISEFRYSENDPQFGNKMFYYDGEWHESLF